MTATFSGCGDLVLGGAVTGMCFGSGSDSSIALTVADSHQFTGTITCVHPAVEHTNESSPLRFLG